MFEILSEYICFIIKYSIENGLDYGKNKLDKRRDVLAKLLILYNSLQDLREKSNEIYMEFKAYSQGEDTPTKIISSRKLGELLESFKIFRAANSEISKAMGVYDNELYGFISRTENVKGNSLWRIFNVTDDVIPKMIEIDGRKTFTLIYPTSRPPVDGIRLIDEGIISREIFDEKSNEFEMRLRNYFNFSEVEIIDSVALADVLKRGQEDINYIISVEEKLRVFIKNNFSLERIFDSMK
ncbi:hypothetical protein [Shinella zoogloeoides]